MCFKTSQVITVAMNSEGIQRCHLTCVFTEAKVSGQALIDLLNHAKENGAFAGV